MLQSWGHKESDTTWCLKNNKREGEAGARAVAEHLALCSPLTLAPILPASQGLTAGHPPPVQSHRELPCHLPELLQTLAFNLVSLASPKL